MITSPIDPETASASEPTAAPPTRTRGVGARTIFDFVTMVAVLAGVAYGALELRQFRRSQEREATFELMRSIQTPEFAQALTTLLAIPEGATADEILAMSREDLDRLYLLQTTWESLGILVHRGDVPLALVDDFYGGPILFSWQRLRPIVDYNRRTFERESLNEWFQWLVERLQESYEGRPEMPPAYEAYRDWRPTG